MRLVAGSTLVDRGIIGFRGELALEGVIVGVLTTGTGILFLAGLWTPFAGTLAAAVELWCVFLRPQDPLVHILLLTMGVALARTRRMVSRRSPLWMAANRHSQPP